MQVSVRFYFLCSVASKVYLLIGLCQESDKHIFRCEWGTETCDFQQFHSKKKNFFLTINICLFDEFNLLRSKIFHTKCQNGWVLKWRRMKKMWEWRAAFNLIESLDFFSKNDMNQNRMKESKRMKKMFSFCVQWSSFTMGNKVVCDANWSEFKAVCNLKLLNWVTEL